MITPLMHILSCLTDSYSIEAPVSLLYLNRADWELIVSEAKRLGSYFDDENKIWIMPSQTGLPMVSEVQAVAGQSKSLNPYTALLLTRVWECFKVYIKELATMETEIVEDDLSVDAVVLRLEGNPKYIYMYVYNTMELPALSYEAKIAKLKELLLTIKSHTVIQSESTGSDKLLARFELQSRVSFWSGLLLSDYIRYYGTVPPKFDEHTIDVMKSEMKDLGFYGFVNPLVTYMHFSNSRVLRKIDVDISSDVVDFLTKVVKSGGASVE